MDEFLRKMAKMTFFAIFDRATSDPKICSRNVWNMIGSSFESWKSTFCEKIFFKKFFSNFCAFLEPKRYYLKRKTNHTVLVPKRHKKLKNFFDFFFAKYGLSAFKSRPKYVPNVPRTDFRIWCSLVENGKKCSFWTFWPKCIRLPRNLSSELSIEGTF